MDEPRRKDTPIIPVFCFVSPTLFTHLLITHKFRLFDHDVNNIGSLAPSPFPPITFLSSSFSFGGLVRQERSGYLPRTAEARVADDKRTWEGKPQDGIKNRYDTLSGWKRWLCFCVSAIRRTSFLWTSRHVSVALPRTMHLFSMLGPGMDRGMIDSQWVIRRRIFRWR